LIVQGLKIPQSAFHNPKSVKLYCLDIIIYEIVARFVAKLEKNFFKLTIPASPASTFPFAFENKIFKLSIKERRKIVATIIPVVNLQ
jgi:hypothetical protein